MSGINMAMAYKAIRQAYPGFEAKRAYCIARFGAMQGTGYEHPFHLQGSRCRTPDTANGPCLEVCEDMQGVSHV